MAKSDLSAATVRALLSYDPETGVLKWAVDRHSRRRAGDRAGFQATDGYRCVCLGGVRYQEHRVIWLYMTGEWPTFNIDHINGVVADNRWANLRDMPQALNVQNIRRARSDSRIGLLGVQQHGSRFRARIRLNGRRVTLGTFDTAEEAHEAYLAGKRERHPACSV